MMKRMSYGVSMCVVVAMTWVVLLAGQEAYGAPRRGPASTTKEYEGVITAVDVGGNTVTIATEGGGTVTLNIDSNTVIELNDAAVTLADLATAASLGVVEV